MKINNITEKDLDSLKQLDRIEYRQKTEDCYIGSYNVMLSLAAAMFFLLLSTMWDISDAGSRTEAICFAIVSIFFSASSVIIILIDRKLQKENFEELNQEYFKIEKK